MLMERGKGRATGALNNTLMQLRKVCNHPFMFRQYDVEEDGDCDLLIRSCGKVVKILPVFGILYC